MFNTNFDDIPIYTTTVVVETNLELDLDEVFERIPVATCSVPKHVSTQKEIKEYLLQQKLPVGTVVSVQRQRRYRGAQMKKPPRRHAGKQLYDVSETSFADTLVHHSPDEMVHFLPNNTWHRSDQIGEYARWWEQTNQKKTHFRNSLTIVMQSDGKLINFKLPSRGKIQMTGCLTESQSTTCAVELWRHLHRLGLAPKPLECTFRTVMTNIAFEVGFRINREALDYYINTKTDFHSLLETSIGYTGLNVKIPFTHKNSPIRKLRCSDAGVDTWTVDYTDFLAELPPCERKKEQNKKRKNTFLVFYSGKTIMSGMQPEYMRDGFRAFMEIIRAAHPFIQEPEHL